MIFQHTNNCAFLCLVQSINADQLYLADIIIPNNKIYATQARYDDHDSDWATFNIRKVQRKGQLKQPEELGLFTPDYQLEKNIDVQTYTSCNHSI